MGRPFYGAQNILDSQNNGYRDTASAISELVDNSIQANAKSVEIILVQDKKKRDSIIDIMIVDDGDGMDEDQFQFALQRSSGTRSGAKKGLGKYGEGLPNASLSQTKRTEVYTQKKGGEILFNYIDIQEMFDLQDTNLRDIEKRNSIDIPLIKSNAYTSKDISTIVRWQNPNRVKPQNTSRICEDLHRQLGRIFRYYIKGFNDENGFKQVTINILVFDTPKEGVYSLNKALGGKVIPFDPMFLMKGTTLEKEFPNYNHPTNKYHCDPVIKKFKVDYRGETLETEVKLIFSYIKEEERYREGKDSFGNTPFGNVYKKRNQKGSGYSNISIMRANREILSGSFGFIQDISLPQHRFWSVEVHIEPVIDDIVGLDNKKQQASFIRSYEEYEVDSEHEILVTISNIIRANIKSISDALSAQAIGRRKKPTKETSPTTLPGSSVEVGTPSGKGNPAEKNQEIKALEKWISDRYKEELTPSQIGLIAKKTIEGKNYHIFIPSDLGTTGNLYEYETFGDYVLIEINYHSQLYSKVMEELRENGNEHGERAIYMLIGALVNAQENNKTEDKQKINYFKRIKSEFGLCLDEYIDNMYS